MEPVISQDGKQQPGISSQSTNPQSDDAHSNQVDAKKSQKRRWLKNPLRRKIPPVPTQRRQSPEQSANTFSKITFDWMDSLLLVGYRRTLAETDFPFLNQSRKTKAKNEKIKEELRKRDAEGEKHPLLLSLMHVFWREYWLAGLSQLIATSIQSLSPLLLKIILQYASDSYYGEPSPVGRGVGLVLALVTMLTISAFAINQWVFRGLVVGGMARASLISLIYSKSLVISSRARAGGARFNSCGQEVKPKQEERMGKVDERHDYGGWSNGKVMNLMSTDTAHIDQATLWSHMLWTTPLQLIIVVTLLIINIGVSALAGLALFAILMPALAWSAKQLARRRSQMKKVTDKRLSLTQEILKSVRFVKFFSWEASFLQELQDLRSKEIHSIQVLLGIRSAMNAVSVSAPILAAMLAFVTYSLTHSDLGAANIFSSLALFYGLRIPLNMLPMVIAQTIDAYVSLERIQDYLLAEEEQEKPKVDETQEYAFDLVDARFTWETTMRAKKDSSDTVTTTIEEKKSTPDLEKGISSSATSMSMQDEAFGFEQLNLTISRNELVAVVGGVASGKTSFLAALAGVMRKTAGNMTQGANMAYCPQQAWIQNSSVRENIIFGRPLEQDWYDRVVDACALRPDFEMLPDGDRTELIANHSGFVEMLSMTTKQEENTNGNPKTNENDVEKSINDASANTIKPEPAALTLIQNEEKGEKGIKWPIYLAYMRASGSLLIAPLALLLLCVAQATNIMSTIWLGYWTGDSLSISNNTYIAVYIILAVAQAFLMFGFAMALTIGGTNASKRFLHRAMGSVLSAPTYFFDTTPLGRIVNRFSKDVDVMDNFLSESIRMYLFTLVQIISIFVLIVVYFPEFIAALVPLCCLYYFVASYYRASAREIKRNESVLRSDVFSKFSEGLSGTATIRAYGMQALYERKINESIDSMDSVYFLTFSNQAWLSIRLDIIGIILALIVGMLVVTNRFNINPSTAGLILTYMLQVIGMVQFLVKQQSEVENSMNSTERVYSYGRELPQEHNTIGDEVTISQDWPEKGDIEFINTEMRYRQDLPLTLKGLDLQIKGGERIGVVGRTGAGKSSIMASLFRLTELSSGSIKIDSVDISKVNLHRLRSSLSIIPQDPTLFRGTVRSNLDPFNEHNDLQLWQALQQAYLVPQSESISDQENRSDDEIQPIPSAKTGGVRTITLETTVQEEGHNFSLGQRQLMALARALVRGSRVIVCDEATSSIDEETDRKIQETMAVGFKDRTVLCIAHRLLTVVNYDRIVVIDNGKISEVGTPFELWQREGAFRKMCDKGQIGKETFSEATRTLGNSQ